MFLDFVIANTTNNNKIISILEISKFVVPGILGACGKYIWDRFISDRTISTQQLLEKNQLTSYARRRLKREARDTLNQLRTIWNPPTEGKKLTQWPETKRAIFVRSFNTFYGQTACPSGDPLCTSTPLFIWLKAGESNKLIAELNQEFEALLPKDDISKKLLQKSLDPTSDSKIWIKALNIEIKSNSDMVDLLFELSKAVSKWIVDSKIVLEIYLAFDIFQDSYFGGQEYESLIINTDISDMQWDINERLTISHANLGLKYAFERSKAHFSFTKGAIFGNLSIPQEYKVPKNILESRFFEYFSNNNLDPNKWSTIAISGPPGSGKTELAGLLSNKLRSEHNMSVLILYTPKQLSKLQEISLQKNEGRLEEIIDNQLIVNNFQQSDQHNNFSSALHKADEAKKDLLKKNLKNKKYPVAILVDDLHSRRDVRNSLFELSTKQWDLHFILIGRTKFTDYDSFPDNDEKFIHIECQLWDKEQSEQMLLSWTPESYRTAEESFIKEWWPSHLKTCSLYLLREIINSPEEVRSKPSILIRTAIEHNLSSIKEVIETHQKSASIVLEEIRSLLQDRVEPEEILQTLDETVETKINISLFLGLLSWFSRYQHQDNILNAEKIVTWSQGVVDINKKEAEQLLQKGDKAKIFSLFGREADWRNKLVAEGCAALYLGDAIDKVNDSTMVSLVESLDRAGSIGILNLVLDTDQLKKIIASTSRTTYPSVSVLDKLLNTEFISKIKEDRQWIEMLGFALIQQSYKVNISEINLFAKAFSRLMSLGDDRVFKEWCLQNVASADESRARFSLAALAAYYQNNGKYFVEVKNRMADSLLAIEMAARLWDKDAEDILCNRIIELSSDSADDNKIKDIWSYWCSRQNNNKLLDSIWRLISKSYEDSDHEKNYTLLISSSFDILLHNGTKISSSEIDKIKLKISCLARDRKQLMASEIVKWVFFYYYPNLSDLNLNWIVDPQGKYALPKKPYKPLKLQEIFAKVKLAYPSVNLPVSKELKNIEDFNKEQRELVRDKFQEGVISGRTKIAPANISTWDGKTLGFLTKDEIELETIQWRPLYILED